MLNIKEQIKKSASNYTQTEMKSVLLNSMDKKSQFHYLHDMETDISDIMRAFKEVVSEYSSLFKSPDDVTLNETSPALNETADQSAPNGTIDNSLKALDLLQTITVDLKTAYMATAKAYTFLPPLVALPVIGLSLGGLAVGALMLTWKFRATALVIGKISAAIVAYEQKYNIAYFLNTLAHTLSAGASATWRAVSSTTSYGLSATTQFVSTQATSAWPIVTNTTAHTWDAALLAVNNLNPRILVNLFSHHAPNWVACKIAGPLLFTPQISSDICTAITPQNITASSAHSPVHAIAPVFYNKANNTNNTTNITKSNRANSNGNKFADRAAETEATSAVGAARAIAALQVLVIGAATTVAIFNGHTINTFATSKINSVPKKAVGLAAMLAVSTSIAHDYVRPDNGSLIQFLSTGVAVVGITYLALSHPVSMVGAASTCAAMRIASAYASYSGSLKTPEMVLNPTLSLTHGVSRAKPVTVEILQQSTGANLSALIEKVTESNSVIARQSYNLWSTNLAEHLDKTVLSARSANKTIVFSLNESHTNDTHVTINCGAYSEARNLLKSIAREDTPWLDRVAIGVREGISYLFSSTPKDASKICYSAVKTDGSDLGLQGNGRTAAAEMHRYMRAHCSESLKYLTHVETYLSAIHNEFDGQTRDDLNNNYRMQNSSLNLCSMINVTGLQDSLPADCVVDAFLALKS